MGFVCDFFFLQWVLCFFFCSGFCVFLQCVFVFFLQWVLCCFCNVFCVFLAMSVCVFFIASGFAFFFLQEVWCFLFQGVFVFFNGFVFVFVRGLVFFFFARDFVFSLGRGKVFFKGFFLYWFSGVFSFPRVVFIFERFFFFKRWFLFWRVFFFKRSCFFLRFSFLFWKVNDAELQRRRVVRQTRVQDSESGHVAVVALWPKLHGTHAARALHHRVSRGRLDSDHAGSGLGHSPDRCVDCFQHVQRFVLDSRHWHQLLHELRDRRRGFGRCVPPRDLLLAKHLPSGLFLVSRAGSVLLFFWKKKKQGVFFFLIDVSFMRFLSQKGFSIKGEGFLQKLDFD